VNAADDPQQISATKLMSVQRAVNDWSQNKGKKKPELNHPFVAQGAL